MARQPSLPGVGRRRASLPIDPMNKTQVATLVQSEAIRVRTRVIYTLNLLRKHFPQDSPIVQCARNIYNNANQLADYMKMHK